MSGASGSGSRSKRGASSSTTTKAPANKTKKMTTAAKLHAGTFGNYSGAAVAHATQSAGDLQQELHLMNTEIGSSPNGGGGAAAGHNLSPISSRDKVDRCQTDTPPACQTMYECTLPLQHSGHISTHRTGNYAGFHAKSIRTIWDQHELDAFEDMDIDFETTSSRSRRPPAVSVPNWSVLKGAC